MSNLEIKEILIDRIQNINDQAFLKALIILTENKSANSTDYIASDSQKRKIEKSINQAEKNQTSTHKAVSKRITKWLKEK